MGVNGSMPGLFHEVLETLKYRVTENLQDEPFPASRLAENRTIASRMFGSALYAMVAVHQLFLTLIKKIPPDELQSPAVYRRKWLLLQVAPEHVGLGYLFSTPFAMARAATNEAIGARSKQLASRYRIEHGLDAIHVVVDEVQVPANFLTTAFASHKPEATVLERRPALRELLGILQESSVFRIVLLGTGLSHQSIRASTDSAFKFAGQFISVPMDGSFDTIEKIRAYIIKFLWPGEDHLSEEAELLILRAWRWLRGRYVCILRWLCGLKS